MLSIKLIMKAASIICAYCILFSQSAICENQGVPLQLRFVVGDSQNVHRDSTYILYYPDGAIILQLILYDRFGIPVGNQIAYWRTTGTLHAIQNADSVFRIYYYASSATGNEEGTITAYSTDSINSFIYGRIIIKIVVSESVINVNAINKPTNNIAVYCISDLLGRKYLRINNTILGIRARKMLP